MNKDDFCKILGDIDDRHIEEAKALKHKSTTGLKGLIAVAASFLLIVWITSASPLYSKSDPFSTEPVDTTTSPQQTTSSPIHIVTQPDFIPSLWEITFNELSDLVSADSARVHIPGYFTENLAEEDLATLFQNGKPSFMECTGRLGFDGEGEWVDLVLTIPTTLPECSISCIATALSPLRDYLILDEPITSIYNDTIFTLYQYAATGKSQPILLIADTKMDNIVCSFTMETDAANLEQAKTDFTFVLACFAANRKGITKLINTEPKFIPEWFDHKLTLTDALADPIFGQYMLPSSPAGFTEESIRRYKDQNSDYLSALWTHGLNEFQWTVTLFCEEDKPRLTHVEEKENFDLTLYPIPRADSVPDEKREIVDNPIFLSAELTMDAVWARAYHVNDHGDTAGWRMRFSVKIGDFLVEIRSKGVDPQWVYTRLAELHSSQS